MHLVIDDKPAGPFTPEQVCAMWREGKISAQTMFWRDGMAEWKPLAMIAAELFPEGILAGTEHPPAAWLAGFWIRVASLFIDFLILGVVGSILGMLFFDTLAQLGNWGRPIGLGFFLAYFGLQESVLTGGQTPGKRICRIRVVGRGGHCLSIGRSLLRTLVWAIPYSLNNLNIAAAFANTWYVNVLGLYLITFLFSLFYLYIFNRRTRQTVHDLVTDSYVVHAEPQGVVDLLPIWKGHYLVIGVWLALLLGLLAFIEMSGIAKGFLAGLGALQDKVYAIPDVRSVGVNQGKTFTSHGTTSVLSVTVTFNHAIPDNTKAEREVAAAVLSDPADMGNPDLIKISVGRAYNIGISSGSVYSGDSQSPDVWRERVKSGK